jgi:hypothetical protein
MRHPQFADGPAPRAAAFGAAGGVTNGVENHVNQGIEFFHAGHIV